MSMTVPSKFSIQPMSPGAVARVTELEQRILALPQVEIHTQHILHAGMYSRTITIPGGVVLTGALIKRATLVIVSGDVLVSRGDAEGLRITGTEVLPASADRKQAFVAHADTTVTMVFPTSAATVEEAEAEFTDDTDLLFSRRDPNLNTIIITGE
jgi:hypothetical protein